MISFLRGHVFEFSADTFTLLVGGVGYEIHASRGPLETLRQESLQDPYRPGSLTSSTGTVSGVSTSGSFLQTGKKEKNVFISTIVREDAFLLFGFLEIEEKNFFQSLLKISGVGPKMALNVLSGGNLDQIYHWIESEDVKTLSQIPKVGKKTAEQIVLALKGKLVLSRVSSSEFAKDENGKGLGDVSTGETHRSQGALRSPWGHLPATRRDITSILMNLGFRWVDIESIVAEVDLETPVETGVRQCLMRLSSLREF